MTTIYELEKQATHAPLELTETGEAGALFYELMVPDGESVCGFYHMPESQDLDNARLIAHCRNNFMKALEALKNCERRLHDAGCHIEADCYRHTIKELETIT